jgi:hypothetical protein
MHISTFDLFKMSDLTEPQHGHVAKLGVEDVTFFKQHFAPDLILGDRRVASENNVRDGKLAIFIDVDGQIYDFLLFINVLQRSSRLT